MKKRRSKGVKRLEDAWEVKEEEEETKNEDTVI